MLKINIEIIFCAFLLGCGGGGGENQQDLIKESYDKSILEEVAPASPSNPFNLEIDYRTYHILDSEFISILKRKIRNTFKVRRSPWHQQDRYDYGIRDWPDYIYIKIRPFSYNLDKIDLDYYSENWKERIKIKICLDHSLDDKEQSEKFKQYKQILRRLVQESKEEVKTNNMRYPETFSWFPNITNNWDCYY